MENKFDVVVAGCGVAGLSAAVAAAEAGARVAVLERAPEEERGGQSRYTEAYLRMKSLTEVSDDFETHLAENGSGSIDPELVEQTATDPRGSSLTRSLSLADPNLIERFSDAAPKTIAWLQGIGARFDFLPTQFLTASQPRLLPVGGGQALVDVLATRAEALGVTFFYESTAQSLIRNPQGHVVGLHASPPWAGLAQLALAGLLALAFVWRQRRVAAPLMQLQLYSHPVYRRTAVVAVIYGAGLFGSTYLLPLFMLVALGLPASQVGQVLMPAGFALAITIPLAGRLADKTPLWRTLAIGLLVMAATFAVMVGVGSATAVAWIILLAVLGRIGLGLVIPSLSLSAMRTLAPQQIAAGAGTMNFLRQLGGAVGVNAVGIGLEWRLQAHAALGSAGTLRAFHEVFVLMALVTAAAALAAWQMRPPRPPRQPGAQSAAGP